MIKLYKRVAGKTHYWEAWINEDDCLVLHWGVLGDEGEDKILEKKQGESPESRLQSEARSAQKDGYVEVDEDAHVSLYVRIQSPQQLQPHDQAEQMAMLEDLIHDCLGWTGNGYCLGHESEGKSFVVTANVLDPKMASQSIVHALKLNDLADHATIAIEKGEDLHVLWEAS